MAFDAHNLEHHNEKDEDALLNCLDGVKDINVSFELIDPILKQDQNEPQDGKNAHCNHCSTVRSQGSWKQSW